LLGAGGDLAVKVFDGRDLEDLRADVDAEFEYVRTVHPEASRDASSELYLVGKHRITAPVAEMKRRADLVVDEGGGYVMIDILTAGWSAVQEMREYLDGRDIGIHAHRAQHAAYTRLKRHGISMLSIARFARLVGVDNLHAGSVVGKMEGGREEVEEIYRFLRSDWHGLETTIPVASGGLHPGLVPDIVDILGEDLVIQAGGGVHGHPDGSEAGGRALRAAADAVADDIPLQEKADEVAALAQALEKWGREQT
ncbi:MAG: RuBisCO large subunit C-terminal-like domain-containing protein, partial [Candidatus Nanohaloarchaea archaeon]|nr:RuBisCO large subunit C-terminal-like domain-containing protein [Candidatus Nanohaloarchaea archaeon]